jgi:predicted nuclease of restriction endonuclease-like (RecB) superfamily
MKITGTQHLFNNIRQLIVASKSELFRVVNTTLVETYFHVGRLVVEFEQKGSQRAGYASQTLQKLSLLLTKEFGRGFSVDNLEQMRKFYISYNSAYNKQLKAQKKPSVAKRTVAGRKSETVSRKLPTGDKSLSTTSSPFRLNWSHYVFLLRIDNRMERDFYEIEAANENWSLRELKRHYESALYERLALSRNKAKVKELSRKGHVIKQPADAIKEPYILEFLGLPEKEAWNENEFEIAIIDKIQDFLKEMGKGFLFVERQQRIPIEEDDHRIDLVFYHRILRCFVLIDLKLGSLSARDIGQMQLYVGYYDREVKQKQENPTIGIVLCKNKKESIVKYTLPKNNKQIFASKYKMYMPDKNDFQLLMEPDVPYGKLPLPGKGTNFRDSVSEIQNN